MNKIVLIDTSGIFVPTVKVINRLKEQRAKTGKPEFILPARVMYFNSLLSCLRKIGIDKNDIVIMAGEGRSFRKNYCASYKAQREGLRKKDSFTDWDYEFKQLNDLHEQLNNSTNWYFIRVADGLEADDIIAISTRYFKDNECIVVTGDKDLHMLAYYKNVKIFSTTQKCNNTKGMYIHVTDPLKILATKCRLGDKSDNIIPEKNETWEDQELRKIIVNLLELPDYIEQRGIDAIKKETSIKKDLNLDKLPPFKNAREKFEEIYNPNHKLEPEYCYRLLEKRKERKKKK